MCANYHLQLSKKKNLNNSQVFHFVFELPDLVDPGHDGKNGGVGDECGFNSSHSQVVCQLLSLVGRGRLGHYHSKLALTGSSL